LSLLTVVFPPRTVGRNDANELFASILQDASELFHRWPGFVKEAQGGHQEHAQDPPALVRQSFCAASNGIDAPGSRLPQERNGRVNAFPNPRRSRKTPALNTHLYPVGDHRRHGPGNALHLGRKYPRTARRSGRSICGRPENPFSRPVQHGAVLNCGEDHTAARSHTDIILTESLLHHLPRSVS